MKEACRQTVVDQHDREPRSGAPEASAGKALAESRAAGEAFLNAGDEAIGRALADDSAKFLDAIRQEGGQ